MIICHAVDAQGMGCESHQWLIPQGWDRTMNHRWVLHVHLESPASPLVPSSPVESPWGARGLVSAFNEVPLYFHVSQSHRSILLLGRGLCVLWDGDWAGWGYPWLGGGHQTADRCQKLILIHPFLLHRVHGDDIITFHGSSFMFPINTVRGFVFQD